MSPGCNLCEGIRHVVERGEYWTLALNRNQNLPGKSVLVLDRHCERVQDLTAQEWASLRPYTGRATSALNSIFTPDLYNFAFLMNFDAHVHLHVVPRYASSAGWRDETYTDEHYRSLFGKEQRPASEEALNELAETSRETVGRPVRPAGPTPAGNGSA